MIQLTIGEDEVVKLDELRRTHRSPVIRRRAEALYLKAKGLAHQDIIRVCGISRMTLTTYLHHYADHGLDGLTATKYRGQPSKLHAYTDQLKATFRANPPHTVAEAQATIEAETGLRRSPTQIRALLQRLGLRLRKTASVPGKATLPDKLAEQAAFEVEQLEPRLQEVRSGKRSLFS